MLTGLPEVGWKKVLQIAGCGTLLGLHGLLFYVGILMVILSVLLQTLHTWHKRQQSS
ncbi:MAG: hypothetical protein SOX17_02525 [Prevotella sp.]|nr:hypothetical protein [Prevotellaceae bacterium]MDY3247359.1 hypothetical protein [Prevotella sp.]